MRFFHVLEDVIVQINRRLTKALKNVLCILFSILIVIVTLNVICRYVFKSPLFWVTEISCYILVYLIFGGAALALYDGEHVIINTEEMKVLIKIKLGLGKIAIILNYAFIFLLIVFGMMVTVKNLKSYTGALPIPMGYVYMAAPLSGVVMLCLYTERVLGKEQ